MTQCQKLRLSWRLTKRSFTKSRGDFKCPIRGTKGSYASEHGVFDCKKYVQRYTFRYSNKLRLFGNRRFSESFASPASIASASGRSGCPLVGHSEPGTLVPNSSEEWVSGGCCEQNLFVAKNEPKSTSKRISITFYGTSWFPYGT